MPTTRSKSKARAFDTSFPGLPLELRHKIVSIALEETIPSIPINTEDRKAFGLLVRSLSLLSFSFTRDVLFQCLIDFVRQSEEEVARYGRQMAILSQQWQLKSFKLSVQLHPFDGYAFSAKRVVVRGVDFFKMTREMSPLAAMEAYRPLVPVPLIPKAANPQDAATRRDERERASDEMYDLSQLIEESQIAVLIALRYMSALEGLHVGRLLSEVRASSGTRLVQAKRNQPAVAAPTIEEAEETELDDPWTMRPLKRMAVKQSDRH